MKLEQKIGEVGNGFVGGAVKFGFSPQTGCDAEVRVYDKNPSKSTHTLEETVNKSDFIYLSVPTPTNEDGSININILESALKSISEVHDGKDNVILIDDVRIIRNAFPWNERSFGDIDFLAKIKDMILEINKDYKFKYLDGYCKDDVLCAYV